VFRSFFGRIVILSMVATVACSPSPDPARKPAPGPASPKQVATSEEGFLDELQERTFRFFWETTDSATGLAPDRWPTRTFASVSATGFALTAYPIGVERGWVTREDAAERTHRTLEFLWSAPQDSASAASCGVRGFFYHFLEFDTGARFGTVELSTVDTALFLAGALFCREYFDGAGPVERELRAYADSLYARVDWRWASVRPPSIGHGWSPERGHLPYDWRGYNEAMLLYVLALGSPTHPVEPAAWDEWTSAYRWGEFFGQEHFGFGPLFGHQYTHVWVDFRGIRDAAGRKRGLDYFENSRRAVLAQRAYAIENPAGWRGYGERLWGLTACDGPVAGKFELDGKTREFHTYWARGASFPGVQDDGTVAPTAAAASIAFAPEVVGPVLLAIREDWGEWIWGEYGFLDSLNPSFLWEVPVQHGAVVPGVGWFDSDYLGIDQGPILAMIENHRTGLVWSTMRRSPGIRAGLAAAGFTGGWLDAPERAE
jgi:hypothetical protein